MAVNGAFPRAKPCLPGEAGAWLMAGGRLKGLQVWHGRHNRKEGDMKRKIKGFLISAVTEGRADEDESSPAIPVLHTALFAGSILAALGIFIFAHVVKSRREAGYDDDGEI